MTPLFLKAIGVAPPYPKGEFSPKSITQGERLILFIEVTAFALTSIAKEICSDLLPLVPVLRWPQQFERQNERVGF